MRTSKLKKTKKKNIYEIVGANGSKQFIVRFSYLGTNYGERNFTKLFGCRTLTQTFDRFQEVKVELSKSNNPFKKKSSDTVSSYFDEYKKSLTGDHKKITTYYYNKHIDPIMGTKKIQDITEKDILKILKGTLSTLSDRSKQTLKVILNPIFKKAIKQRKLLDNPLDEIKFVKPKPKNELPYRVRNDSKEIVKILYREINKILNKELRAIFLIGLMTARRRGEILGLRYKDIKNHKVFVSESITKTRIVDEFPLPDEVVQIISKFPSDREHIFTTKPDRVSRQFSKMVKQLTKQDKLDITEGSKLTFHDTRNLFATVMGSKTNNPLLVDSFLSHSQQSIMARYMSFSYESRKKVFEEYWDIIRG